MRTGDPVGRPLRRSYWQEIPGAQNGYRGRERPVDLLRIHMSMGLLRSQGMSIAFRRSVFGSSPAFQARQRTYPSRRASDSTETGFHGGAQFHAGQSPKKRTGLVQERLG